jgi:hypothetical protein
MRQTGKELLDVELGSHERVGNRHVARRGRGRSGSNKRNGSMGEKE